MISFFECKVNSKIKFLLFVNIINILPNCLTWEVKNGIITVYLRKKEDGCMNMIKEADFRKAIKSEPDKAYLFFGDEDYMKSFAVNTAIQAISPDPSLAFFNEIRLDSFTYSPDALLDALMPLPMMAERKIVIISGLDLGAMKPTDIDALCDVIDQLEEYDYNTVIINVAADRLDPGILPKRPSSLLKKLGEHMTLVNFEKNTPHRLAVWVGKHFEHNGLIIRFTSRSYSRNARMD